MRIYLSGKVLVEYSRSWETPSARRKSQNLSNEGSAVGIDLSICSIERPFSKLNAATHFLRWGSQPQAGLKHILLLRPVRSSQQHLSSAEITGMCRHTHLLCILYEEDGMLSRCLSFLDISRPCDLNFRVSACYQWFLLLCCLYFFARFQSR